MWSLLLLGVPSKLGILVKQLLIHYADTNVSIRPTFLKGKQIVIKVLVMHALAMCMVEIL